MAQKRNKLTPNQQAFKKELARIQRAVKRAEKKGYIFENDFIPKMPNRVTQKSLNKIKDFKTPQIYKFSQKLDTSTGELVEGKTARRVERKESAKKAQETKQRKKKQPTQSPSTPSSPSTPIQPIETPSYPKFSDIVINNFLQTIEGFNPDVKAIFERWMNTIIYSKGREDFAEMLEQASNDGIFVNWMYASNSEMANRLISQMLDYLPDVGELTKQQLTDAFENDEDWDIGD